MDKFGTLRDGLTRAFRDADRVRGAVIGAEACARLHRQEQGRVEAEVAGWEEDAKEAAAEARMEEEER